MGARYMGALKVANEEDSNLSSKLNMATEPQRTSRHQRVIPRYQYPKVWEGGRVGGREGGRERGWEGGRERSKQTTAKAHGNGPADLP